MSRLLAVLLLAGSLGAAEMTVEAIRDAADRHAFPWFGSPLDEARATAEAAGRDFRVARSDEEHFPLTRDLRPGRITVEVDHGLITLARVEGEAEAVQSEGVDGARFLPLLGLQAAVAEAKAAELGMPYRVVSVDGDQRMVTMDYRPERANVSIRAGVVVLVTGG